LRPCRQASTLFTSTRAAHLRTGSGFRVSVQTEQEPLTEAAALLDFRKKKELSFKEKEEEEAFIETAFLCVCVVNQEQLAYAACVFHLLLFATCAYSCR